jgi:hypothetical protein
MNRRHFLVGAASGVAAFTGIVAAQAPAAPAAPAAGRQGGGGGGRGRGAGSPANVPAAKLARLSMMTLNHGSILKLPWNANPNENQTVALLDLPQFYIDTYGIRNVEFQHGHLAQSQDNPDPTFFREFKAKFDAVGSKAVQINIEIGTMASMNAATGKAEALAGDARATWLVRGKKWVDVAPIMGITRLMINQGALTDDSKAGVGALWKELQDYARPKGVMISAETRGSGAPAVNAGRGGRGGRGGEAPAAATPPPPPPPAAPPMPEPERIRYVWQILMETIELAGGYSNLDFGGAGRFRSQQQVNDAIKGMLPRSAGSMHIKSSPEWDIASAVRYAESLGYKGLYTIEVNPDPAIRIVYNTILSAIA